MSTNRTLIGAAVIGSQYLNSLAVTPAAVWSFKKLISTATSSMRVRRSSDNAEQDISFVVDSLDTASLASFVGANSAYVTKFYDQTGNGYDLVQTTTGKQPRIYNAGVFDGKAVFDGSDDFMKATSFAPGSQFLGMYHKVDFTYASYMGFAQLGTAYTFAGGWSHYSYTTTYLKLISANGTGGSAYCSTQSTTITNGFLVRVALGDRSQPYTSECFLREGGVDRTYAGDGSTTDGTGNYATADFYVGALSGGTGQFNNFKFETGVLYNADSYALRATIEGKL